MSAVFSASPASPVIAARHRARLSRRRLGLAMLGAVALFALIGPPLIGQDVAVQDLNASLLAPGAGHWLGTDVLGRDQLARLAAAVRLSFGMSLLAALSAAVPGVLLGVLAAWRGGATERALALLCDAMMSVPGLLLIVLFAALAPGQYGAIYAGLAVAMWTEYFRVARSTARPVLAGDGVQASRLLGFGSSYVLMRHLLPALAPVLGTLVAFTVGQSVLALAALSLISVGLQAPTPELGLMMFEALPFYEEAPWLMAAPVGVLSAMVLGMMWLMTDREAA